MCTGVNVIVVDSRYVYGTGVSRLRDGCGLTLVGDTVVEGWCGHGSHGIPIPRNTRLNISLADFLGRKHHAMKAHLTEVNLQCKNLS